MISTCKKCGRLVGRLEHNCPKPGENSRAHLGQVAWNKGLKYGKKWGNLPLCLDCNKELTRPEYKRCKKCNHKGELGSNWKGGITPIIKQQRALFRQTIKNMVFERDKYTCQLCGARNGNGKDVYLQVDHIQSWSEYVELRFSMDNCRTLCMPCHYKVTFGKPMPDNIITFGYNKKTMRKNQ